MQHIAQLALLVRDYDEAIRFYTGKLRFSLVEDKVMSDTKRWVVVSPPGNGECRLLLARAVGERQLAAVGNQAGGRIFLFMHTDDIARDLAYLTEAGVDIIRGLSTEPYGQVAVFSDLYGNWWDLIQPVNG